MLQAMNQTLNFDNLKSEIIKLHMESMNTHKQQYMKYLKSSNLRLFAKDMEGIIELDKKKIIFFMNLQPVL